MDFYVVIKDHLGKARSESKSIIGINSAHTQRAGMKLLDLVMSQTNFRQ